MPRVALPLQVSILQARAEVPQRSTAQHAALLAPDHARVHRPFPECAASFAADPLPTDGTVALLYPSEGALTPSEAAASLPSLAHLVVIDASWSKSVSLLEAPCLQRLPRVSLPPGLGTRFWRYAPLRGDNSALFNKDTIGGLLATIEAVHRFCDAFGVAKGGVSGACDDLLWLFAFQYGRVREVYEQAPGKRQRIIRKSKGLLEL